VFDETFFGKEFARRAKEFAREHGGLGLRVEVVTSSGDRLDVLEIKASSDGTRLVTRDERLVFLPYAQIAHVDVTLLRDHRIEAFELPGRGE
jgi:hypothetical protein